MLARLPLRSKLILVVSIPLFVILGFAGFGIANRLGDLEGQRQYGRLRVPNGALGDLQRALEDEGVLTAWSVAAPGDLVVASRLERARAATDRARRAIEAAGRGLAADDVSGATRRAWDALVARLDTLGTLRRQADERAGLPAAFGDRYAGLTDEAIDLSGRLARDTEDRRLADSMLGIVSLRREQAERAREAMIVLPFLATGASTHFNDWVAAVEAQKAALDAFLSSASPAERAAFTRARPALADDAFRDVLGGAPAGFRSVAIMPDQYYSGWKERQDACSGAIGAVQRVVDVMAADLESSALSAVLAYGLGVSALVLGVLVLAWMMVRSVNRSLHSLTEAARDVAENQLPHLVDTLQRGGASTVGSIAPLPVVSRDEIGALARAFNTIQETTVRVAEEQAALLRKGIGDLYVNLARRNQSLVDRQIALLDALEARAEDPDQLASLFELDHLATRMRRNAESLLVLSGAGQARQWTESIPVLDVVRAASGEIADFARVSFVGFESEVAVAGNAVADVTHILAELLENATAFSPPGTPVVVAGMPAERRFVVSITDEGIGMDDQRLAAANLLLAQPPPPGLSLSRTFGLHVVAHLALRHGIRVQLRRAATNGITALVALPATVLTRVAPEPVASPAPPPSAPGPMSGPAVVAMHPTGPARAGEGDPVMAEGERVVPEAPVRGEPVVVPPPFDPTASVPTAATAPRQSGSPPADGEVAHGFFESDGEGLPRRVPGSSPLGADGGQGTLPQRTPGRHLSHRPAGPSVPKAEADLRPRPERVHDLLTRHLEGIRDGRGGTRVGAVEPESGDGEVPT